MAYLKRTTGQRQAEDDAQSSLVSQGSGALGSGPVAGATGTSPAGGTAPAERSASTPQYVSGQQYLQGNQAGAQKLATQIVEPIKTQAANIEESARQRALGVIGQAGGGTTDQALMTRAGQDARLLNEQEQAQIKSTLSGVYGGPTDVDFGDERSQVSGLGESTERLGTVAGLNQELLNQSGGRKYSSGMRNFDAMLMRQDPTLRTQLAEQAGLGERVGGTIDTQKQAALDAIATGQSGAKQRGVDATKYFQDIATGQEGTWTDELGRLRTAAGGIADRVSAEDTLTDQQLRMIGLDAGAYDQMRDAYVASSYGRDRPLTYDENYNYDLNSPTQLTAGDAYTANAWRNFQLDPFTTGLNVNDIGYSNVVDQESLAKYQALNALRGGQNVGWAPQTAGTGDLTENALNFNNVAAQQALAAFMKSGVAAPRSNLDYMQGMYGEGGYGGFVTPETGTPGYTTTGDDIQVRDPVTGKLTTAMSYTGPKSQFGYATDAYNPASYAYDQTIDRQMLADRARRSGGDTAGAAAGDVLGGSIGDETQTASSVAQRAADLKARTDAAKAKVAEYEASTLGQVAPVAGETEAEADLRRSNNVKKRRAASTVDAASTSQFEDRVADTAPAPTQQEINLANMGQTVTTTQADGTQVAMKPMFTAAKPTAPAPTSYAADDSSPEAVAWRSKLAQEALQKALSTISSKYSGGVSTRWGR